jgi:hypothetical protein
MHQEIKALKLMQQERKYKDFPKNNEKNLLQYIIIPLEL